MCSYKFLDTLIRANSLFITDMTRSFFILNAMMEKENNVYMYVYMIMSQEKDHNISNSFFVFPS